MRISEYQKIPDLSREDTFLVETGAGTKGILADALAKALSYLLTTPEALANIDLSELESVPYSGLKPVDNILASTPDGCKRIGAEEILWNAVDALNPSVGHRVEWLKRKLYRGYMIGTSVSNEQYDQIESGHFKGLFLGDYWYIGGVKWRIIDFDYWIGTGQYPLQNHHIVVMPDTGLMEAKMNETNTNSGGYLGSEFYSNHLNDVNTIIEGAFGKSLAGHNALLINSITNGNPDGAIWTTEKAIIPNEISIFGCKINSPSSSGMTYARSSTVDKTQFAAFSANPYLIMEANKKTYWLRDTVASSFFCTVNSSGGYAHISGAGGKAYVRPVFAVVKPYN